jgi:uncharacterized protein with PQ loop repeat
MAEGLHHYHLRKRGVIPSDDTPHIRMIDKMIFVIGALGPILTIPQVYDVWVNHQAMGVSVISWTAYVIFDIFWVYYGVVHKERAIIFTYILWIMLNGMVALGAFIYR